MDLDKMHCKNCEHWRRIYIHPWSEGIPEELKCSRNGFACLLPTKVDFIESFNGRRANIDDLQVDVTIGKDDTIGCENFEERSCLKIVEGRRCYNCVHYIYDENNDWHDMCNYSRDNSISECDPYEAESCSGFKLKS